MFDFVAMFKGIKYVYLQKNMSVVPIVLDLLSITLSNCGDRITTQNLTIPSHAHRISFGN